MAPTTPDPIDGRPVDGTPDEPGPARQIGAMTDYSGAFVADFDYEDLSHEALVRLVREYAQIVHILDRSMCAAIGMSHGLAEMQRLAIEEWRGQARSTVNGSGES